MTMCMLLWLFRWTRFVYVDATREPLPCCCVCMLELLEIPWCCCFQTYAMKNMLYADCLVAAWIMMMVVCYCWLMIHEFECCCTPIEFWCWCWKYHEACPAVLNFPRKTTCYVLHAVVCLLIEFDWMLLNQVAKPCCKLLMNLIPWTLLLFKLALSRNFICFCCWLMMMLWKHRLIVECQWWCCYCYFMAVFYCWGWTCWSFMV